MLQHLFLRVETDLETSRNVKISIKIWLNYHRVRGELIWLLEMLQNIKKPGLVNLDSIYVSDWLHVTKETIELLTINIKHKILKWWSIFIFKLWANMWIRKQITHYFLIVFLLYLLCNYTEMLSCYLEYKLSYTLIVLRALWSGQHILRHSV